MLLKTYQKFLLDMNFRFAYVLKLIKDTFVYQVIAFVILLLTLLNYPQDLLYLLYAFKIGLMKIFYLLFSDTYFAVKFYGHKKLVFNDALIHQRELAREVFSTEVLGAFALSFTVYIFPLFLHKFLKKRNTQKEHLSGSKIVPISKIKKFLEKSNFNFEIGGYRSDEFVLIEDDELEYKKDKKLEKEFRNGRIRFPIKNENRHSFIIGRPGSGKSVMLKDILDQLSKTERKLLIHDFKGDMLSLFYDEKDLVFNPLDKNHNLGWTIFNDIENEIDIETIAKSIIPENSKDPYWNEAARDVLVAILTYLLLEDKKTNKDIWEMLSMDLDELQLALESKTETKYAVKHISGDEDNKQAISVISVLIRYTKFFKYLTNSDGDFSIKQWIEDDEQKNKLFLINYPKEKAILKPIITLFFEIASKNLLQLKDNLDRRIYFFIDELGELQKMDSLVSLLTNGRSKGASVWLAIQDIGQVEHVYGKNLRQAIMNACSNYFIFGVNDFETARLLSEKIGDSRIKSSDMMMQLDADANTDQIGLREAEKVEKLIIPSEIQNLPDRVAYLQLANIQEHTKIKFYVKKFEEKTDE